MFRMNRIMPHVYHLDFDNAYDLGMHFLRYQEYYESPKWHCRIFSLVDYMEWYSKEHGKGAFTYAKDWSGFNVPSWVIWQVNDAHLPDPNRYDDFMRSITKMIIREEGNHDFYLIGTSGNGERSLGDDEEDVLDHEIAHALYEVDPAYFTAVEEAFTDWATEPGHRGEEYDSAIDVLKGMGYHESTTRDEVHAYCATGLCDELKDVISKKERKPFQKIFREFKRQCKLEASK